MRIFKLLCLAASLTLAACLPTNGSFGDYYIAKRAPAIQSAPGGAPEYLPPVDGATGVYVNGILLTQQQVAVLAEIIKERTIPVGRYYIHANGDMGLEGQAPLGNIIPYVREYEQRNAPPARRSGRDVVINSQGGVGPGTLVGDGTCMMASVPGVSVSSGC